MYNCVTLYKNVISVYDQTGINRNNIVYLVGDANIRIS